MTSTTLKRLLQLTWSSPVFQDSFAPAIVSHATTTLEQMAGVYECFMATLRPVLAKGMPHATEIEVDEVLRQVGPKSTAFCPAISAGEITDRERLCAAAVAIAISYWADQSMDRGDEAMITAVRLVSSRDQKRTLVTRPLADPIQARLLALRYIEHEVRRLSHQPEDRPYVLRAIYNEVLENQAAMRDLSRRYVLEGGGPAFWSMHAEAIARLTTDDSGLMSAVTVLYAIYRHFRPELPSLAEIYDQVEIMSVVRGPCNAAVRVFDDLGDRWIDDGRHPEWGVFNLNIFNQPKPALLQPFLRQAGFSEGMVVESLMASFQRGDKISQTYIVQGFVKLVRDQLLGLPPSIWGRYGVFLTLCKRTLEAGYVNSVGDIALAATGRLDPTKLPPEQARAVTAPVDEVRDGQLPMSLNWN